MNQALFELVRRAGDVILEIRDSKNLSVEYKGDQSPLTRADRESHALLASGLPCLDPSPVLSEEGVCAYEERRGWKRYWLIDPLDGTKEFVRGEVDFTINVSLMEGGFPVESVVYVPVLRELYWARTGAGAWLFMPGATETPKRLPDQPLGERSLIVSRSHPTPELTAFAALNDIPRTVPAGAAFKFCQVARRVATHYARWAPCSEWDSAAGHHLVLEAGGSMRDLVTGAPPVYNKPVLLNNAFFAVAAGIEPDKVKLPPTASTKNLE